MSPATQSPSSRQTDQADRYLASDFDKLTIRAIRRFTTPGPSPDLARPQAHEPRASAAPLKFATPDKRDASPPKQSTSCSHGRSRRVNIARPADRDTAPVSVHANDHGRSGSIGGPLTNNPQFDACVKEDGSGIAQSFLESINASGIPRDDPRLSPTLDGSLAPPDAGACDCCCRCGKGAKLGRNVTKKSKSYTNLRTGISEVYGWDNETSVTPEARPVQKKEYGAGESLLEKLPSEILDDIIANLAVDLPPTGYDRRNVDLIACLLASKTLHVATINTLYRHITVPHSSIFSKFLNHVTEYPGLGTLVRRLDLSHFTSVGFGRSRQLNSEIQNLTATTLRRCLEHTPWVQEVLLQENLDDDIDSAVLNKIFLDLPKLRAVDFCASSSPSFVDSFRTTMTQLQSSPSTMLGLKRLSLHECFTLPSSVFDTLLPRLTQLTHLEVSHTRITDSALASLPHTAKLTHLNLGRCTSITGAGVADFLTTHPASSALVYLNLSCDITRYRLFSPADVDALLPGLPSTLQSLNLNGAPISPPHLRHLIPLTKHLEELGLAATNLTLEDINTFFRPSLDSDNDDDWLPSTLHYLDLTALPTITQSSLFHTPSPRNILLSTATLPLEVIELGDKPISSLRECRNTNKRLGWTVKELGRRGWYVREPVADPAARGGQASSEPSSPSLQPTGGSLVLNGRGAQNVVSANADIQRGGKRAWKMGAMWWGMRKCPVAWGEVGGLYGHYMFKK